MNGSKKTKIIKYAVAVLIFCVLVISWHSGKVEGARAIVNFRLFLFEMVTILPMMFVLVALIDVWIPASFFEKHIGKDSGIKGIGWVILFAMFQAGPLYGAFPVAHLLWKKGGSMRNVFIYLGSFATMKLPMMTFETAFLGLKFTLVRTVLTLPVFIAIAAILSRYLRNKNYSLPDNRS